MAEQMFEHVLEPLRGWFEAHALTKVAKLSADITLDPVPAGRCAHLNADGEFELGAKVAQMPIFLRGSSKDPDAVNDGEGATKPYGWTAIQPTAEAEVGGLVASGGFEIATTEFDKDTTDYAPNDPLHAPTEDQITGTDKSAAGVLYKTKTWPGGATGAVAIYTENVCGIVSGARYVNHWRADVLPFWSVYLPGTA